MTSIICPKCGKELNDYEINKLWCTSCNAKFKSKQDLYENNPDFKEKNEFQQKLQNDFLITTGEQFSGYIINQYCNLLNSEVVMGTGMLSELNAKMSDIFGETSYKLEQKLQESKKVALKKIIDLAIELGCNAVIGFRYDIFSFSNNIISVSAYGTAVKVTKNKVKE
jgi:uncharacterized protein YbjQ (UPF0145 family)